MEQRLRIWDPSLNKTIGITIDELIDIAGLAVEGGVVMHATGVKVKGLSGKNEMLFEGDRAKCTLHVNKAVPGVVVWDKGRYVLRYDDGGVLSFLEENKKEITKIGVEYKVEPKKEVYLIMGVNLG